jgi:hypothetical protein
MSIDHEANRKALEALDAAMKDHQVGKQVSVDLTLSMTPEKYQEFRSLLDSTDLERQGVVRVTEINGVPQGTDAALPGKLWRKDEQKKRLQSPGEPDIPLP